MTERTPEELERRRQVKRAKDAARRAHLYVGDVPRPPTASDEHPLPQSVRYADDRP
jgi:hypothetical protein